MIKLNNLSKTFITKDSSFKALDGVSLEINSGDIFGIIGLSGAGKSTLIRLLNRLEEPDCGEIYFDSTNVLSLSNKELRSFRQKHSMIFQGFNLLSSRTVAGNIGFPLEILGWSKKEINSRVDELLELVELSDKKLSYPSQLSGGQKQRVAIARALANNPKVLLCDEATSALDPQTTHSILSLLRELQKKFNLTIVMITHQMEVVKEICDRVAIIESGKIIEENSVEEIFSNPKSKTGKNFVNAIRGHFPNSNKISNVIPLKQEVSLHG